jgi:hypothetical protein
MAGIGKCMALVSTAGFLAGSGISYYTQNKANKIIVSQASAHAKDGVIPIGGKTKDGALWDGQMTVDQLKKDLNKKSLAASGIIGLTSALGTAAISGLTLLIKAKL